MADAKASTDPAASQPTGDGGLKLLGVQAGANVLLGDDQLAEYIRDVIATALVGSGSVSVTPNDAGNTITISGVDTTLTTEQVQDIVGAMAVAGANVTVTYDDTAGTLTIAASGGGGGGSSRPAYIVGRVYPMFEVGIQTNTGAITTTGKIFYQPFCPEVNVTIDSLGVMINGGSAGNARIAIYASSAGLPTGAPLASTSNLSTGSMGMTSGALSSSVSLTAGTLYFIAVMADNTTASFVGSLVSSAVPGSLAGAASFAEAGTVSGQPHENAIQFQQTNTFANGFPTAASLTTATGSLCRLHQVWMKVA